MKYYGSYINRVQENQNFTDEIKVGTPMTEYSYSDRTAYEVIKVKDQNHVTVREYTAIPVGEAMSNNWKLVSDENNSTMDLVKRGQYWYKELIAKPYMTTDEASFETKLWLAMNGFDIEHIRRKGYQKKYHRVNVSFGIASYYYDYTF